MLSHRTPTKPGELRKNEPNPMGLLAPIAKLFNHLTEDLVLRIQKSNEIRIGHPRSVVHAMVGGQLAEGAGADEQQGDEDRASEISEVAGNPKQRSLPPTCPSFGGRYGQVHIVAGK